MSVTMPMMQVGIMRMAMHNGRVPVPMRMRLGGSRSRFMLVLVVYIVFMGVLVFHYVMGVLVFVALREVQPESQPH